MKINYHTPTFKKKKKKKEELEDTEKLWIRKLQYL